MERAKLNRLYALLKELEKAGRDEDAAAIRWAIFKLERKYNVSLNRK